ncbi:MAG: hypothetical protein K0R51_1367 [Cytophagaceae bacterium]|jgi:hypothetical protein|nr:hypothetical protein [Cytophagaceae bacterium]
MVFFNFYIWVFFTTRYAIMLCDGKKVFDLNEKNALYTHYIVTI